MSSAPADGKTRRKRTPFEPWRKVMLLGALILLAQALLVAITGASIPRALSTVWNFLGYGFLVAGFGMKMRDQKAARSAETSKDGEKDAA